jgi:tetratricopeptide (TPR) repeat protein
MIIDNVDDPSINLFSLIPKARNCHVIITTRDSTRLGLTNPYNRHVVGDLDEKASIELLLRLSSCRINDANTVLASQIAEELGYLPLALTHAGGYISIHGGLSSYLETYRKSRREMLEHLPPGLPSNYNLAVAATIEMSFTRLPHRNRDILHILSQFQAASIAEAIIVKAAEGGFARMTWPSAITLPTGMEECVDTLVRMFCPNGRWSQHDFNQLIQPCLQYSLLRSRENEKMGRYFSMHPLVQSWLRLQTRENGGPSKQDLFVRLLASSITIGQNYEYIKFSQVLRPHIESLDEKSVKWTGDKHAFRHVLYENADYSRALDYLESCAEDERKFVGEEHQETLISMHNLSFYYSLVGKYTEALKMGVKAVELRQRILGDEHPDTLSSMHGLSLRYSQVGRYAEALEMGEKVTELHHKTLGAEHPQTLRSMHNLSIAFTQVGRYAEALEMGEKVMGLDQKILGEEHPETLGSMHILSICYSEVGRYVEGLEMGEKATGLYQKTLGNEHPDTLRSMSSLSTCYYAVGRHAEALDLGLKVMKLFESILGKEHPETLEMVAVMMPYYYASGKYDEALPLALNALDSCRRVLGLEHPLTKEFLEQVQYLRSMVCSLSLGQVLNVLTEIDRYKARILRVQKAR